ncbi:hypothetical protein [Listeria seeligeri]|uniref:hypothetical protein n=1 Tax=Listeria seeligeri TaxID=1640 RepID=UPI001623C699|nr:hypothetical protein [Listeria seeligeri]MBC1581354.1 hypothetical protein [Listeria seeligeri]MBC1584607.1 hypothetical protein [Listeria seeligeri]MBC1595562.1 hypothetical protein [Listeria seeligeri]MBC1598241.1 hypothetical protein [Listeria seeligeri]MBC1932215.1 hypothetical protein [Listeria seeligeri]
MNTLKIKISFNYLLNYVIDWDIITFGVNNSFFSISAVGEYVVYLLENNHDVSDEVLNLSWGNRG